MDISLKHEDYKALKILTETMSEEVLECEILLPEYMPEILRIVKSVANLKVNSCNFVGERLTVDGVCEFKVIYVADDGCIYAYNQSCPFTKYKDIECSCEVADSTVNLKVNYVNCRATGTKKVAIKTGIIVKFNVFCTEAIDVIDADESCCIEKKCVPIRAMSLGCRKTGQLSMSDTITLDTPCSCILSYGASSVCSETRKINNKLMIKGETIVDICYVNSDNKTETKRIRHILPINQIMEFDGMEEQFTGTVVLDVKSVDVVTKGESEGVSTAFEISLCIDASVTMWEEKLLNVISDAYAVNKRLELSKKQSVFYSALSEVRESFTAGNNFSLSVDGVKAVLDCCGEVSSVNVKADNQNLTISGSISVSVIIKDNNDNISNVTKVLDYCYNREIVDCSGVPVCKPDITLVSLDCYPGAEGLEIKGVLNLQCSVFEELVVDSVSDMSFSDVPIDAVNNAITVYFPSEEKESLWAIARRYNTTVAAIADENDLEGETTESLKVLFIPAV